MNLIKRWLFKSLIYIVNMIGDFMYGKQKPCREHYFCDVNFLGEEITVCSGCGKVIDVEEVL